MIINNWKRSNTAGGSRTTSTSASWSHSPTCGSQTPSCSRVLNFKFYTHTEIPYGNAYLFLSGFKFYEGYPLPDYKTVEEYMDHIINMPLQDIPEVFGLHSNADISYQVIDTLHFFPLFLPRRRPRFEFWLWGANLGFRGGKGGVFSRSRKLLGFLFRKKKN